MFFSVILDIDECHLNIDECSTNALCYNNIGSYCCVCVDGYYGNGFNCSGNVECCGCMTLKKELYILTDVIIIA